MPQDFYGPISGIVKMGCSKNGALKRVKCAEVYIGALFGEVREASKGGPLRNSVYPSLEILRVPPNPAPKRVTNLPYDQH